MFRELGLIANFRYAGNRHAASAEKLSALDIPSSPG